MSAHRELAGVAEGSPELTRLRFGELGRDEGRANPLRCYLPVGLVFPDGSREPA